MREIIFNSYHMGKSKNDASQFMDVLSYTGKDQFLEEIKKFCPAIAICH
jgi:hypothetical protein